MISNESCNMKYLLAALLILFAGCAATERYAVPKNIAADQLATVHFYRSSRSYQKLNPEKPYIYLNGKVIARLGVGQAKSVKIPAGRYSLTVREPVLFMPGPQTAAAIIEVAAGEVYYLRYDKSLQGLGKAGTGLVLLESNGFQLVTKANYQWRD